MNSNTPRRGKSAMLILIAGAVFGALVMAAVHQSNLVPPATAQRTNSMKTIANVDAASLESLKSLDQAFAGIASYALNSTVHIRAQNSTSRDDRGRLTQFMGGEGSGIVFRPDGYIVTNDHVVAGFDKVTVTLNDGREFAGKVIRGEDSDIAVVKIDAKDLPAVEFADSGKVRAGQYAIAVGSPFGLENSVTIGHVSAIGRDSAVPDFRMEEGGRYYPDLIQTDAAINMGNSGGPLLNIEGQVIGINTAIFSRTGTNVGIGFAIPSNQAKLIADLLIDKGKISRGYIGVRPVNLKEYQKKEMNLEGGALVGPYENSLPSPARDAGIKEGDVIVRIGTFPIRNQQDLRNSLLRYAPGETVKVEYVRSGERKTVDVKLADRPKPPARQQPTQRPNRSRGPSFEFPQIPGFPNFEEFEKQFREGEEDVPPLRSGPAKLGVNVDSVTQTLRNQFHIPSNIEGAVVVSVEPGSVAQRLGIKPGDVIQSLGDKTIRSGADLAAAMKDVQWGDTKHLKFSRYGENTKFTQSRDVKFE